jgi:hypothetical protein
MNPKAGVDTRWDAWVLAGLLFTGSTEPCGILQTVIPSNNMNPVISAEMSTLYIHQPKLINIKISATRLIEGQMNNSMSTEEAAGYE